MESTDRKVKAESLVRQYSFQVAADLPENEIAQFLMKNQSLEIAKENKDRDGIMSDFKQWLCAESPDSEPMSDLSENEDLQLLFKERRELVETWLEFQTKYPEHSELLPDTRGPPSIETLQSIMKNTAQDWENKRDGGLNRAKEKMIVFSESLLSFSDLFSIIPQGDKYVSLFTGVVSTTIKAAARHKEIAEGFSSALEEIGKAMSFSTHQLKIHRTKRMERLVIRLYMRHANFFCKFMKWYLSSSWKRLTNSLQNNFYTKEVQHRVEAIRSVAKEIEQEASLITQLYTQQTEAMVRNLGTTMEEFVRRTDLHHDMFANYFKTTDKRLELLSQWIGQLAKNQEVGHFENELYKADGANAISECLRPRYFRFHSASEAELAVYRNQPISHRIEHSQDSNSSSDQFKSSDVQRSHVPTLLPRVFLFTRPSLQQVSQHLQSYYPSTSPGESSQGSRDLTTRTVSGLVVVKLKQWLTSPRSDFLWILGSSSPFGNEATLAASHILDIAISARLPFVSFSCTPITKISHASVDSKKRCVTLLVALLYSLIHQLLCWVPETFGDAYDLEGAIETMNGGEESIPKALEIIQALLRHRTPLLLIILDGLELVEDDNTVPYIRNLISIIHSRQIDSRLKVLLGSQGFLTSCGNLDVDERVDCTLLPRRRPGRAQPGGRFLGELDSFSM